MPITKINPDTLPDAGALGYTQTVTSPPGELIFCSGRSQLSFEHSSRSRPLKLSMKAFCVGFPGAM